MQIKIKKLLQKNYYKSNKIAKAKRLKVFVQHKKEFKIENN